MAKLLSSLRAFAWLLSLLALASQVQADLDSQDASRLAAELPRSVKFEDPQDYYNLGDEFAHGFFAQVYHATPKGQPDVKLAIKKMKMDSAGRAQIAINEVLIGMHVVAGLPHTVAYRDTYVHHDHIWFVMDYVPGTTVEKIPPKQWTHDSFCTFITMLLDSVLKYHEMGVCHGDLKSKNMMIHYQKQTLVIVDFGLSRFMPEKKETISSAPWRQWARWPRINERQWLGHGKTCNDLERVLEVIERIHDESSIDSDAVSKMIKWLRMAEKQKISLSRMLSDPMFDEWRSGKGIVLKWDKPRHTHHDDSDYEDYNGNGRNSGKDNDLDWQARARAEKELELKRQREAQAKMNERWERERATLHRGSRKDGAKTGGSQPKAKRHWPDDGRRSNYVYDGMIEIY